jgi:hypothetical protein
MTPALEDTDRERRALRLALAMTLSALWWDALAGDGYGDDAWTALHAAAPLLGIALQKSGPGPLGEEVVRAFPDPDSVLAALREREGALPSPPGPLATVRDVALLRLREAAEAGGNWRLFTLAEDELAIAWRTIDALTAIPTVTLADHIKYPS